MMKLAIILLSIVFLLTDTTAGNAEECATATPPTCVQGSGYFDNKDAEKTCRDAVKIYQKSVSEFWDCQRAQANAVNDEARKVIRLFNCRVRGKETCE